MKYVQRANKGRCLELTIERSQINARGRVVTIDKMGTQVKFVARGQTQVIKSPPDFIGSVNATATRPALPICFDAKECEDPKGFPIRKWGRERPLQREWILRQGEAGAIAGLLVEAKALRKFLWLGWREIRLCAELASIGWGDSDGFSALWVVLGDTLHAIDFAKVPGVAPP